MDRSLITAVKLALIAICCTAIIFALTLLPRGSRPLTALETIKGTHFSCPPPDYTCEITEKLAHFDVELREPVLAKKLLVTLTFRPLNTTNIYLGVRENSFWLSYPWQKFYDGSHSDNTKRITTTITIPLTDKLQDTDRSIDVMFLAGDSTTINQPDEGIHDTTHWQITHLEAKVVATIPSLPEVKKYLVSLITRERPL